MSGNIMLIYKTLDNYIKIIYNKNKKYDCERGGIWRVLRK